MATEPAQVAARRVSARQPVKWVSKRRLAEGASECPETRPDGSASDGKELTTLHGQAVSQHEAALRMDRSCSTAYRASARLGLERDKAATQAG
jgi:hypothetical protein